MQIPIGTIAKNKICLNGGYPGFTEIIVPWICSLNSYEHFDGDVIPSLNFIKFYRELSLCLCVCVCVFGSEESFNIACKPDTDQGLKVTS